MFLCLNQTTASAEGCDTTTQSNTQLKLIFAFAKYHSNAVSPSYEATFPLQNNKPDPLSAGQRLQRTPEGANGCVLPCVATHPRTHGEINCSANA